MKKTKTEFFKLQGKITEIFNKITIKKKNSPDFTKIMLTIVTKDGQVLYPELRNNKIKMLGTENILVNDSVEIEYSFQGSEKNDKHYNNIYINKIKKI